MLLLLVALLEIDARQRYSAAAPRSIPGETGTTLYRSTDTSSAIVRQSTVVGALAGQRTLDVADSHGRRRFPGKPSTARRAGPRSDERRRTAHRGAARRSPTPVPRTRDHAADSTRRRRGRRSTSSASHGDERAEASAEYDGVEVEEVDDRRERRYRAYAPGLREARSTAGSPASARRTSSAGDAARALTRLDARGRRGGRSPPGRRSVSRQPRLPHAHGSPSGSTVMWPNSPPKPWAPRKSSPSTTMPAPTPTSPKTQMKLRDVAGGPLPVLGQSREVRLVLDADREIGEPGRELVGDRRCRYQPRFGRAEQRARLDLDEARHRDRDADDARGPPPSTSAIASERHPRDPVEHGARTPSAGCRRSTRRS